MSLATSNLRSVVGLLALQALPRVGAVTALKAALGAPDAEKAVASADAARLDAAFAQAKSAAVAYRKAGVALISFFDELYPDRLRELADPPPVLFTRGRNELLSEDQLVAVVGTRQPTSFGTSATVAVTSALADAGFGIVSGLARGVDTVAHETALDRGAPTIAVMGGGLDSVYPAENRGLARRIVESGGLLVSEQPFGAEPRPHNLVARDRIQSGLSLAVVVAQSGVKSGTMHTARYAATQGRPIFCPVPSEASTYSANEGLRTLLTTPANQLSEILPAWKSAARLCRTLPERPLAWPVEREGLSQFVDALANRSARSDANWNLTVATSVADH